MIEEILSNLGIKLEPIPAGESFLEKHSSEKKLFEEIEKCLHENGIKSGYTLGRFRYDSCGDDSSYALFKYRGYWIVSHVSVTYRESEHVLLGLFLSPTEAADFFLCKMLYSNNKYFDWGKVLSPPLSHPTVQ